MKSSARTPSRLLALFSGASTLVPAIAAVSLAGAALAPTQALAANECTPSGDPADNGATADTYICPATTYASGITYTSAGALSVTTSVGTNVGATGINLTGQNADTVTLNTVGLVTGTGGPVIDVLSNTGAINITTAGITGSNIAVTYGILSASTSGAITINTTGTLNINSSTAGASQIAAISATTAGAISITTAGSVTGRQYGIQATGTGTAAVTINANNAVAVNTTAGVGVAAIDATAGSGSLTINVGTGSGTVNGSTGSAIRTNSSGAQTITVASGRTVSVGSTSTGAALLLQGAGNKTITNSGSISAGNAGLAIQAAGNNVTITNNSGATLSGRLTLTNTGTTTFSNTGTWSTTGTSAFNTGASTLTNNTGGTINVGASTVFTSLETFNNGGTIALGSNTLTVAGTTFNGTAGSTVTLNVACAAAGTGCLDLSGSTVTGETALVVSGLTDTAAFDADGILLVNVAGGTTADGDFVLGSTSTNFVEDPTLGGIITTSPLFGYALRFDEEADAHVLLSVPRNDAFQFVPFAHETISVWQTTTDTVVGRQADLRDGAIGGGWVRYVHDSSERDLPQSFTSAGNSFAFDNSYSLETDALIAGFDLMQSDSMVIGVHGGYVRSQLEYDNSATKDELDGVTLGLYGALMNPSGLTVDATFNTNLLTLDHSSPTFEDNSTNVISIGARGEVGWRMPMGETFYVQPLGTLSFVNVDVEDVLPTGYEVTLEDVESLAAAFGVRVGGSAGNVGYWLTGRSWTEMSDDASVTIRDTTAGSEFQMVDAMGDDYQEVSGGLSFSSGAWTGYATAATKMHDEVDNYSVGVGLRLNW